MGLGLLPWEGLPAYILGPLICTLSLWLISDVAFRSGWELLFLCAFFVVGIWIVWSRFKTGEEPLWTEKQRNAARRRKDQHSESH